MFFCFFFFGKKNNLPGIHTKVAWLLIGFVEVFGFEFVELVVEFVVVVATCSLDFPCPNLTEAHNARV